MHKKISVSGHLYVSLVKLVKISSQIIFWRLISKISNFNKFGNNLDSMFLGGNSTLPSECAGYPFVEKDHNYTLTSNLEIADKLLIIKTQLRA